MTEQTIDRADFLKLLGVGAGVTGLGALAAAQAGGSGDGKGKYVFVVTSGASNPSRAILPLLLAQVTAKKGLGAVHVWMSLDGADLAHKDRVERIESPIFKKFGNALALMKDIKERGGTIRVCPPCAEWAGSKGDAKLDFVEEAGGDWLMENIAGANVVWL